MLPCPTTWIPDCDIYPETIVIVRHSHPLRNKISDHGMVDTSERDRPLSPKWHLHGKALSLGLRHARTLYYDGDFWCSTINFARQSESIFFDAFKKLPTIWAKIFHYLHTFWSNISNGTAPFAIITHQCSDGESQLHVFRAVNSVFLCRFSAFRAISLAAPQPQQVIIV